MPVSSPPRKPKLTPRAGFALIVVLAALLVLAGLFAIAQSRAITALQQGASERALLTRTQRHADMLRLAIAARLAEPDKAQFDLPQGRVALQDVGGLIDVNSATPDLLDRFGAGLGITAQGMRQYRTWRQAPHRAVSLGDFARLTGLPPETVARLPELATVHSGRTGLAPDLVPEALWRVLNLDQASLPPLWQTEPSGLVFSVVDKTGTPPYSLGVIQVGTDATESAVLAGQSSS